MKSELVPIEAPYLPLKACSVEEHCEALINLKHLPFWWYQGTSRVFGNFSVPFKDPCGNWWYQVKPGFCWPVEILRTIEPDQACPPLAKAYFGYQHLTRDESKANSRLVLNTILELKTYGAEKLNSKRRNKIRNGYKNCSLEVLKSFNKDAFDRCRAIWDDLSTRTGWKHAAKESVFNEQWCMLLDCPGITIIIARDRSSGEIAGFYIIKIIGDTAYSDTIAVYSDMLNTRANDVLRHAFLANAMKLPGVTKGWSAIKSSIKSLEYFKVSLGYEPCGFYANTHFVWGMRGALKLFFPEKYNRMMGRFVQDR
jgi:hypothetical protein